MRSSNFAIAITLRSFVEVKIGRLRNTDCRLNRGSRDRRSVMPCYSITVNDGLPIECCEEGQRFPNISTEREQLRCLPIKIPPGDVLRRRGGDCINFVRSVPAPALNCQPGPLQQVHNYIFLFCHVPFIFLKRVYPRVSKNSKMKMFHFYQKEKITKPFILELRQ